MYAKIDNDDEICNGGLVILVVNLRIHGLRKLDVKFCLGYLGLGKSNFCAKGERRKTKDQRRKTDLPIE